MPGKPQSARNDFLIRIFGNPCDLRIPGALCPDFSVIGTFYQDFWFVGVFVGMVLMGVFSAALWKRYQERQTSSVALVLAASWTVSLPIIIRAGFMPSFQWWLEFIVPALLGLRIARGEPLRRRRRVRPRARPVPARTRYHRADPVIRSRSQR